MAGSNRFWKRRAFKERAEALWDAYFSKRTEGARDELLGLYMPLCNIVARRVCNTLPLTVDIRSLRADAALGLLRAIRQWQPHKSAFITYSLKCMRGAIMDGLRSQDPISRWARMLLNRLVSAKKAYMEKHGVEPSVKELARFARLPLKVCLRHAGLIGNKPFQSIEEMTEQDELDSPSVDTIGRKAWMAEPDPEKHFRGVMMDDFKEWLLAQIDDPRAKRICHAYLIECVPQREIGKMEGLHESRIFQILEECRALWLQRSEWLRGEKEARDGSRQ